MNNPNLVGLLVGALMGVGFGWLQWNASLRYEKDLANGRLARVPGAMGRVALLLAGLVAVQLVLPPGCLWWVTSGLLAAMLLPLSLRLRRMRQHR
jgi:hypothetical protein